MQETKTWRLELVVRSSSGVWVLWKSAGVTSCPRVFFVPPPCPAHTPTLPRAFTPHQLHAPLKIPPHWPTSLQHSHAHPQGLVRTLHPVVHTHTCLRHRRNPPTAPNRSQPPMPLRPREDPAPWRSRRHPGNPRQRAAHGGAAAAQHQHHRPGGWRSSTSMASLRQADGHYSRPGRVDMKALG